MSRPKTLGSAVSAIVLAGMLAGCAAPSAHHANASAGVARVKVPAATSALTALGAGDFAAAVSWAEKAVEANREDADVRALLGTAYFAAGRFASAETAYEDALALQSSDPKVVLKLALVQVAQGKQGKALSLLHSARNLLDSADYGLALALAGQPGEAIAVLEPVARSTVADARVRQNLALSHALAGDWTAARTVAAQDVPPDQLDARIQQWMKIASPVRASDQVAALTGVTPTADTGQPVGLALRRENGTALAASDPVVAPAPVVAPVLAPVAPVQMAEAAPAYVPPTRAGDQPAFKLEPVDVAQEPFVEVPAPAAPVLAPAPRRAVPSVRAAAFVPKPKAARPAVAQGKSTAVVQIGAYASPQRVAQAWNAAARRYGSLRRYMPMSARFQSAQGPVYRLSVKGFGSASEAKDLCIALRRSGGTCFVRNVAGDSPVRMASR